MCGISSNTGHTISLNCSISKDFGTFIMYYPAVTTFALFSKSMTDLVQNITELIKMNNIGVQHIHFEIKEYVLHPIQLHACEHI